MPEGGPDDMLATEKQGKPSRHPPHQSLPARLTNPSPGRSILVVGHPDAGRDTPPLDVEPGLLEEHADGLLREPTEMGRVHDAGFLVIEPSAQEIEADRPMRDVGDGDDDRTARP